MVATPIGNLEDITLRAIRTLKEADYILAEDTRVTGKLLKHHGIETSMKRYDAHTSEQFHLDIIDDIKNGKRVALVSDAGTPGVSDPGVLLVQKIRAHNLGHPTFYITIEAIPGPSSVTAAFSIAGLAGNQFTFLGFAPQKKGRQTFFQSLADYDHPVIFFESTHRIMKTLDALANLPFERTITVARELTKLHEELVQGAAGDVLQHFTDHPERQKGEHVVMVST